MILAAGLGTRLRPWTLEHPKALVPVGGVPMLERVVIRLRDFGFDRIVVNIHHFGNQIIEFIEEHDYGVNIEISDEREELLDTGGAVVKASRLVDFSHGPLLVHNVDIVSNADLGQLYRDSINSESDVLLLVSDRDSSRKLVFDDKMMLKGWHNTKTGETRPSGIIIEKGMRELAFSGIYIIKEEAVEEMRSLYGDKPFSVIDYFCNPDRKTVIEGICMEGLEMIDIGKPASLAQAQHFFDRL